MTRVKNNSTETGLEQVIEPLASYICASQRPRAALRTALELLLSEVEQTNRAARARVLALAASMPNR